MESNVDKEKRLTDDFGGRAEILALALDMGNTLSSSSITIQLGHVANDRINLLK